MRKAYWTIFYLLLTTCVDPVQFDAPPVGFQLVVDGLITDEPGPYTITLSTIRSVNENLTSIIPFINSTITLNSDAGESEVLVMTEPGVYQTTSIQGQPGVSYWINIDDTWFSELEKMEPGGKVEAVDFELQPYQVTRGGILKSGARFNVFADGRTGGGNFLRWRLSGTYKMETFPELHTRTAGELQIPDPLPCSGYVVNGQFLQRVTECTCCTCWISEYSTPIVSDDQLVSDGLFTHVRVGYVDINRRSFSDKYYVEVQQLTLSEKAFYFWKAVQAQKEGASSLFQPAFGKLRGNMHSFSDESVQVSGYFGASSVRRKSVFLTKDDVPFYLPPIDTVTAECRFTGSSTLEPPFWK